jgi:hypothetical protein
MMRIPLWQRDGTVRAFTIVDDGDYRELSEYRWHRNPVNHSPEAPGYAVRLDRSFEPRRLVQMSRQLLELVHGDGLQADHINGSTLDNRRANLRVVTHAENQQNKRAYKGSVSSFRGVWWEEGKRAWRACGRINGKRTHVGWFRNEVDAARAVEAWRREHMPFAQPDPAIAQWVGRAASELWPTSLPEPEPDREAA